MTLGCLGGPRVNTEFLKVEGDGAEGQLMGWQPLLALGLEEGALSRECGKPLEASRRCIALLTP